MTENTKTPIVYILDTETTGLADPEPVEVVYYKLPEFSKLLETAKALFEEVDTQVKTMKVNWFSDNSSVEHLRFKPTKPIDSGASKINGIYFKDVMYCPSSLEFTMPDCGYIVAHNAIFDYRVIKFKDLREAKAKNLTHTPTIKLICTKELAQLYFASNTDIVPPKNNKLTTLIEYFYPEFVDLLKDAHSAKTDTFLCLILFLRLVHLMPDIASYDAFASLCSQGKKSYETTNTNTNKDNSEKLIEIMPFGMHKGKRLVDIPSEYLGYCLANMTLQPSLEKAIRKVYNP